VVNPVASVDRPRAAGTDRDIHYLDLGELEALLGLTIQSAGQRYPERTAGRSKILQNTAIRRSVYLITLLATYGFRTLIA
jgi:hypothetical protein